MSNCWSQKIVTKVVCYLFLAILFFSCKHYQGSLDPEKPNVLLIITDDLDYSDIGYYGGTFPTPEIDSLAKTATHFTNAYTSSSGCTPSRFSILTGRYAGRCQHPKFRTENPVDEPSRIEWNTYMSEKDNTIHEAFGAGGYKTAFIGKWHLSPDEDRHIPEGLWIDMEITTKKGNEIIKKYDTGVKKHIQRLIGADTLHSVQWGNANYNPTKWLNRHHPEWLTTGAINFLSNVKKDEPFFLSFSSTSIHSPSSEATMADTLNMMYTPEGKLDSLTSYHADRSTIFPRLDSAGIEKNHRPIGIIWLNDQIAGIRKKLREMGVDKNTIIVFVADHNLEPGKGSCYDSGIRTPLFINWPENVEAPATFDKNVSFVDIMPTLLSKCGVAIPSSIDGKSFISKEGKLVSERKNIYLEYGWTRGIRNDRFKYIAYRMPKPECEKILSGELEMAQNHINRFKMPQPHITMTHYPAYYHPDQLYDLVLDPYEQHNLAYTPEYQDQLNLMKKELQQYLDTFDNSFDLSDTGCMLTPSFEKAAKKTQDLGISFIPWASGLRWPPKETSFPQEIKCYSPWEHPDLQ